MGKASLPPGVEAQFKLGAEEVVYDGLLYVAEKPVVAPAAEEVKESDEDA